jgi:hypothetical protein
VTTRGDWVDAFLVARTCPQTPENVVAVLTWIRSEWGGWAPVRATWNPLNTTYSLPPQSDYNSVGVKNYETFEQGVTANSRTLALGYYPAIRAALEAGDDANRTITAIHASPWGSKPNAGTLAYVRNNLGADSALLVGVGTAPPHLPPPEVDMPLNAADLAAISKIVHDQLTAAIGGAATVPPTTTIVDVVKHYAEPAGQP